MGEEDSFELPAGFDLSGEIRLLPWDTTAAEAGVPIAHLEVDAHLARQVTTQVAAGAVVSAEDGGISVTLPAGDENAFVSWVVGLGDTAVVTGPPELRQAVVRRLMELAEEAGGDGKGGFLGAHGHEIGEVEVAAGKGMRAAGGPARRPAASGNVVAGERLRGCSPSSPTWHGWGRRRSRRWRSVSRCPTRSWSGSSSWLRAAASRRTRQTS